MLYEVIWYVNEKRYVELLKKKQELKENPGKNPFVNEQAWKEFLDEKYKDMEELIAKEME